MNWHHSYLSSFLLLFWGLLAVEVELTAAALRMAVGEEDVRRGGGGVNGSGHLDGGGVRRFSSRAIAIAAAATPMTRAAAQMRSSRIADVRRKETRGIEMMPRKGEDDPPQDTLEFGSRGSRGATMMPALEIFVLS